VNEDNMMEEVTPFPNLRRGKNPVSEKLCFLVFKIPGDRQSPEAQKPSNSKRNMF
jgi:hypothetical protein